MYGVATGSKEQGSPVVQPTLIAHADWGTHPNKRWMARAVLENSGRYVAHATEPVGDPTTLLARLQEAAGTPHAVLLGFDFPIGLPAAYTRRAGIDAFLDVLPRFGTGEWAQFYDVAEHPDQVHLRRPFFPQRCRKKGQARQRHLLAGLGLASTDDLRRRCERGYPGRRPACPLFWTVGGQQVGKAAISGWRDILGPALRSEEADLAIWPFSGPLFDLLAPGRIVVVETYPGEVYGHLGLGWRGQAGRRMSKRVQGDRRSQAPRLVGWAGLVEVELAAPLRQEIQEGFGSHADGEDRFDALVGLLGMLNVVLGYRAPGEPDDEQVRRVEGWILGQGPDLPGP